MVVAPGAGINAPDLIALCAARLPAYEVPVALEFRASLPKNPAGKVLKAELTLGAA